MRHPMPREDKAPIFSAASDWMAAPLSERSQWSERRRLRGSVSQQHGRHSPAFGPDWQAVARPTGFPSRSRGLGQESFGIRGAQGRAGWGINAALCSIFQGGGK